MPRANRYFLPGHVWHITHRCHQKDFLLKFAKDRQRWRRWLFEAKKRYSLCVLNYIITSNHIHLLVRDCGQGEIAKSMQLIAGRTAQEYNQRKGRFDPVNNLASIYNHGCRISLPRRVEWKHPRPDGLRVVDGKALLMVRIRRKIWQLWC